jgi:acylphosphatase
VASLTRAHLRIRGHVQGVSFRYYARQRAESLGLAGWVRNASDGSVEVVVEGTDEAVQRFIDWAHDGPSMARVEQVEIQSEEPEGLSRQFRIVH